MTNQFYAKVEICNIIEVLVISLNLQWFLSYSTTSHECCAAQLDHKSGAESYVHMYE